mgnify:CR=1 FL=1
MPDSILNTVQPYTIHPENQQGEIWHAGSTIFWADSIASGYFDYFCWFSVRNKFLCDTTGQSVLSDPIHSRFYIRFVYVLYTFCIRVCMCKYSKIAVTLQKLVNTSQIRPVEGYPMTVTLFRKFQTLH